MAIVYTVGEISNNNIKIYTEQGWKMTTWCYYYLSLQQYIQLPFSNLVLWIIFMLLLLISPTVYTIVIFQPCSLYYFDDRTRLEDDNFIYCWKIRKITSK
jgi:hypothetical protein